MADDLVVCTPSGMTIGVQVREWLCEGNSLDVLRVEHNALARAYLEQAAQLAAMTAASTVCAEIMEIMATYREQEASRYGVDTPGGLEHMGDVWRLLGEWDERLRALAPR